MTNTLAGLRAELQRRSGRIKKAAQLLGVEFGPIKDDGYGKQHFTIRAQWKGGGTHFFVTEALAKYKPCWIMRQIIQDIFMERNV